MLRFIEDCLVECVISCDDDDNVTTVDVEFFAGDEVDGDVVDSNDQTTTFQFGDGSVAYQLANHLFVLFEIKDKTKVYEDHEIHGLIVRGTNEVAIVVSKGLMFNFELHVEKTTDEDAFLKCIEWRKGYFAQKDHK